MPLLWSQYRAFLQIIFLSTAINSRTVLCQTQDTIQGGRQLIQGLFRNFSSLTPTTLSNPVDLIFILDRSASVGDAGWQSMLRFVQNFLEHFTIDQDNTRVSVISYSTTASVDIDDLRNGEYSKCALVSRLQKQLSLKVPAGYSATHAALLRAKDVVLFSRANAKKAVIVITDGKSNVGPPPVRASILLRSLVWDEGWNSTADGPQLQIYAFGIKDAYMPEVRSIASPLQNHTFYIPTFQTFAELARSLHDDSQSENWQILGTNAPCNGICDVNAYCACGTRSGHYLCVCKDGYQGDGTICSACPRGTYKNSISPSRCVVCPENSTTLLAGAADVKQCVCHPPYYQDATGRPCYVRRCPDLPEIQHGHKFHVPGMVVDELPDTNVTCQNLPDSSCHFLCDVGYRLDGDPGLVCHANGSWVGRVPSCHIVDCETLSYHQQEPDHASLRYLNDTTTYGSMVQVGCHQGWRAFGDTVRNCTHFGVWSGTQTWCVETQCPALSLSPGMIIMPATCGQAAQKPGATCQHVCGLGYQLRGPPQVVCDQSGTWDISTPAVCVDREPPSIRCPDDITTPITTANFAVVHWKSHPPLVNDNSGEFILTYIGVEDSEDSLRLTAGYHQIKYIARDRAGNEASCIQGITVVDFTVHLVSCPETDVSINMTSHRQEAVWPVVLFADHNNVTVDHRCVPANNTLLPAGIYSVVCTADTHTYQRTHCQFTAILRQPTCEMPPAPLHGSVSCAATPTSLLTCIPQCNENYDFHHLPQGAYVCDLDGNWRLRQARLFWPDCSRKYLPHKALIRGRAKYAFYEGECEEVKDEIALAFKEFLENQAWDVCGAEACSIDGVSVSCGGDSKRRRRGTESELLSEADGTIHRNKKQLANYSSVGNFLSSKRRRKDTIKKQSPSTNESKHRHKRQLVNRSSNSNLPMYKRKETRFSATEDSPTSQGNSSMSVDNVMNNFVSRQRITKREVDSMSVVDDAKIMERDRSVAYGQHKNEDLKKSKTLRNDGSLQIEDMDGENGNKESDEEGVITRELYQIDKRKRTELTNVNLNQTKETKDRYDNIYTEAVKEETEAAQCGNCTEKNARYDISNEAKSTNHLRSTVPDQKSQKLEKLSGNDNGEEMLTSENDEIGDDDSESFLKRSVGDLRQGNHFRSGSNNSQVYQNQIDLTPNNDNDDSSTNATLQDYDNEVEYIVVNIELTLSREFPNQGLDDAQQSDLVSSLMDVWGRLDRLLQSNNVTLHDSVQVIGVSNDTSRINTSVLVAQWHELELPALEACQSGYVTNMGFYGSSETCVACPAGSYYYMTTDQCITCPVGYYQPEEAQSHCLTCPNDTMTEFPGAHNISMCLAACEPGQFSGTGLEPCHSCPLHSYQPFAIAAACVPCPMDRKTLITGAVDVSDCLDLCLPGTFSETGLVPCRPCPVGAYQPDHGATECLLCEDGLTTTNSSTSNASDCFPWDACFANRIVCNNGGHCMVQNNAISCVCVPGFSGENCEVNMPDCLPSSCQNNATCVDGISAFTCDCLPGFTGTKCEVNIDECLSAPCLHGGSCLDLFDGFKCFCSFDFTGAHCETPVQICNGNVCVHGTCERRNGGAVCVCRSGFAGSTCNTSFDLCSSQPCVHAERCESSPGQFTCHCLPGFSGAMCDVVFDLCEGSNCSHASTCMPAPTTQRGYICKCPGGWSGVFCSKEATADFDLVFVANSPNGQYVVLPQEFLPSLQNLSVCVWLRPDPLSAFATIVSFTLPLPALTIQDNDYVVSNGSGEFETVFSLKHTDKLLIEIFDHSISTNLSLTFYAWTHLCVTWSSPSSTWRVVINGSLSAQGTVNHVWSSLPPNVHVVLGQSNPFYSENSLIWDVYTGEMTQFNIFSHALSLDDIRALANGNTCNKSFGDVVSWTDVLLYIKGDLEYRETSRCLDVNECWFPLEFPCGHNRECVDLVGSYDCSSCLYGYTGSNCEHSDDECALDTCQRGDCVDGPEPYDFRCDCPVGYTGQYCDVMIDLCLSAPCQNGGTCNATVNSFSCRCPQQNMGPLCERPASPCFPNPCQNHGVCHELDNDTFQCLCPENFSGRLCERRRSWCNDHVCYNGGLCRNHSASLQNNLISNAVDDAFCECQNGWMGRQCEVRVVLSCELSPCVNGGTCVSGSAGQEGYRCQCLDTPGARVDENCEFLNPCDFSPCTNNTLCVSLPNYTFVCVCAGGRSCDSSHDHDSSKSSHNVVVFSTEKTVADMVDGSLTTWWIWASIGVPVLFVLFTISFISCFLWRKKRRRLRGEVLSHTTDVVRGHLTNPGFHSEELQLEESLYAELGDGYTLPQDGDIVDDQERHEGTLSSVNHQRMIVRNLSSSSGSFSSFRSSSSRKTGEADDTSKLLLLEDYLVPMVTDVARSSDSKLFQKEVKDEAALLLSGVSNAGFDSSDYVISDTDMASGSVRNTEKDSRASADNDNSSEEVKYLNELNTKNIPTQHGNRGEYENADFMFADDTENTSDRKMPSFHREKQSVAGNRYVNMNAIAPRKKIEERSDQTYNLEQEDEEERRSSGYIPVDVSSEERDGGDGQMNSRYLPEDQAISVKSATYVDNRDAPGRQFQEVAKVTPKQPSESYIPFADIWSTRRDSQSTNVSSRLRTDKEQASMDTQPQPTQPSAVAESNPRGSEEFSHPALLSDASAADSPATQYHNPKVEIVPTRDPTSKRGLNSASHQPPTGTTITSSNSPSAKAGSKTHTAPSVTDKLPSSLYSIDEQHPSSIASIPEYEARLASAKPSLSHSQLARSGQGHMLLSIPEKPRKSTSPNPSQFEDFQSLKAASKTSRTLPDLPKSSQSSFSTNISLPTKTTPSKSPSLPFLSRQTKSAATSQSSVRTESPESDRQFGIVGDFSPKMSPMGEKMRKDKHKQKELQKQVEDVTGQHTGRKKTAEEKKQGDHSLYPGTSGKVSAQNPSESSLKEKSAENPAFIPEQQ